MDYELLTFQNEQFGCVRVTQRDGEAWFVAADVCKALEIGNPSQALTRLDDDEKMTLISNEGHSGQRGGAQMINVISEPGLYTLILSSRKPEAHAFRRWITHDVIPSLRKHRAYIMPDLLEELQKNTEKNAELLASLAAEQRNRIKLEEENRKLSEAARTLRATVEVTQPKATYYDLILENPDAVPITLIAKDYGYSAVKFNALLHEYRIQFAVGGTWELYQEYADCGYTHNNVHYTKTGRNKVHMCWTQRGRLFLYEFLKKEGILPMIEQPRQEEMA